MAPDQGPLCRSLEWILKHDRDTICLPLPAHVLSLAPGLGISPRQRQQRANEALVKRTGRRRAKRRRRRNHPFAPGDALPYDHLPHFKKLGTPKRYKFVISYHGNAFHGWQKQIPPNGIPVYTVHQVFEDTLREILQQKVSC